MTNASSSSPSTSTFSSVIDIKEDKANKVGEGLAEKILLNRTLES
jgi:hypothetical protein